MRTQSQYFEAIDATWPAAAYQHIEGWLLRNGQGGGKRVSAASQIERDADIGVAVRHFEHRGETPLFMLTAGEDELDAELASLGFKVIDPVVVLSRKLEEPTGDITSQQHQEVTKTAQTIWIAGGISFPRFNVMMRAAEPRVILTLADQAVAFASISNGLCMVHAVEVLETARGKKLGTRVMQDAMIWAARHDADEIAVLTVKENAPALGLYRSMGFGEVASYHYRIATS